MTLRLITPPTAEPVSLAEAKLHLRKDASDEDALITRCIAAAREECEQKIERSIMQQDWEVTLDAFPRVITLPRPPIVTVTSLKYLDSAGVQQTLAPSAYVLDAKSEPGRVVPAFGTSWPAAQCMVNAVEVRYTAGYADAGSVPSSIKDWILIRINTLYEFREQMIAGLSVAETPFIDGLLDRYRVWSI
jgi:uncharacterized phiE125 gp8 family phage protein